MTWQTLIVLKQTTLLQMFCVYLSLILTANIRRLMCFLQNNLRKREKNGEIESVALETMNMKLKKQNQMTSSMTVTVNMRNS